MPARGAPARARALRDAERRTVVAETLGGTFEIGYERLVVALGAVPRTFPIPGLAEHGRGFKDVADAIALRNHLLRSLESAAARLHRDEAERDLGFVFVGGGYAGVEALAELNDLARDAVRRSYPTLRDVRQRWVLVDAAPRILSEIPRKLGEYTHRYLERRGIEIRVGTTLASFDESEAVLADGTRDSGADARLGCRRPPEPRPRDARPPARRARPRPRRRHAPRGGPGGRLGARRLRRGAERADARSLRPADLPARAPPGAPAREEHAGAPRPYGYRMLGQVATLGRYKGIAELPGCGSVASSAGSSRGHTTSTRCRRSAARRASSRTGRSSLFFQRDIVELSALGHPRHLDP